MKKKKIILPKLRYENAPETDSQISIGFESDKSLLRGDDRDVVLNLSEQFTEERANCKRYKLYGKMRMVFRNLYAGATSYDYLRERLSLVSDGSDNNFCGYLPYNEFAFLRDDIYYETTESLSVTSLSGFTGFTMVTSGPTEHQTITSVTAPYHNWNLYTSYISGQVDNFPMKYTLSGRTKIEGENVITFTSGDGIPFRVEETEIHYVLTSPVRHGISRGEYILIDGRYYYVNSVGDNIFDSEYYVINILKSQLSGVTFNPLVIGKRCIDIKDTENSTSKYYVHKHTILTSLGDCIIDKVGFESPIWEDEKKVLYENSVGDNDVLVVRNRMEAVLFDSLEPFILTGITNNLGHTPIELYTTIIFRNGNGYFEYPPKVGYSFHMHDSWIDEHFDGSNSIETGLTSTSFTREGFVYPFFSGNSLSKGSELYGAFVEYNPKELKERIISESYHKIVSNKNIFNHGQDLDEVFSGASETNQIGLLYQPHHRFKLKELSPYIETADDSTPIYNLPENAKYFPNEKLWRWRDVYEDGYIDPDGYGVDHPYLNNIHFVHKDINFYIRNEKIYKNKKDGVINFYRRKDVDECVDDSVIIKRGDAEIPEPSISVSPSVSLSVMPSITPTPTLSVSISITPSISMSSSQGTSSTPSPSLSLTRTPSVTRTPTRTPSLSISRTPSRTPSITPSSSVLTARYVSSSGSDTNNGLTESTPWRTLDKVNAEFSNLNPGTEILLKKGDSFYGTLVITKSGTSGSNSPFVFGTYGDGNDPIIHGFTTITDGWTHVGNNVYSHDIIADEQTNMVLVNGVQVPMGRWPNGTTYRTYESFNGASSITDNTLSEETPYNWVGAEVVIRMTYCILGRFTITGHTGNTISYSGNTIDYLYNNFGYFIQNDIRTLDVENEWYHDHAAGKFYIYGNPAGKTIQIATKTNIIQNHGGYDYITLENLSLQGSIGDIISFDGGNWYNAANTIIRNCILKFGGSRGIDIYGSNGFIVDNIIEQCNDNAIHIVSGSNTIVTGNTITNIGLLLGQSKRLSANGIYNGGTNSLIDHNIINNIGLNGITAGSGTSGIVKHNFINNYCLTLTDGGGIYHGPSNRSMPSDYTIENNICLNGYGNYNGTTSSSTYLAEGIYLDSYCTGHTVQYNICAHNAGNGIKLSSSHDNILQYNLCFDNKEAQLFSSGFWSEYATLYNNTIRYNQFIGKEINHYTLKVYLTIADNISNYGISNYNYYARPINQGSNDVIIRTGQNSNWVNRTLSEWRSYSNQDANSNNSLAGSVSNLDDIHFIYNETDENKYYSLSAPMKDVANTTYSGIITLSPWSGLVLLGPGTVTLETSPTISSTPTPTRTTSVSITRTPTRTPSLSFSRTPTRTPSVSISRTPSVSLSTPTSNSIIADHNIAKLSNLLAIPSSAITNAKSNLHIAYEHTSHGEQLVQGMTGLVNWRGSTYSFNNGGSGGALDLRDHAIAQMFSCWGMDLGNTRCPNNEQYHLWAENTRTYLETNPGVNVVIWSWCGQVSYATQANINTYLTLMNQLEIDYPSIKFVYMTGHVDGQPLSGTLFTNNTIIRNYCINNNKILFDFADIESYDPDGNYYADKRVTDCCNYDYNGDGIVSTDGGDPGLPTNGDRNWALDWQNTHQVNVDWYNCNSSHSYPLNANMKAYAAWWLWARLGGWSG